MHLYTFKKHLYTFRAHYYAVKMHTQGFPNTVFMGGTVPPVRGDREQVMREDR